MKRRLAAIALLVTGGVASAQTLAELAAHPDVDAVRQAWADLGCVIRSQADTGQVIEMTGLSDERWYEIIEILQLTGQYYPEADGSYTLLTGPCEHMQDQ